MDISPIRVVASINGKREFNFNLLNDGGIRGHFRTYGQCKGIESCVIVSYQAPSLRVLHCTSH